MVQVIGGCTVYLAGRLAEAQVCELSARLCGSDRLAPARSYGFVPLDAVGVDMLRRLRDNGAKIVGVAETSKTS